MSGRYGIDTLFYVLFAVAAVLVVANMFIGSFVLQLVIDAILIYAFYRVLSRNISARRRENQLLMDVITEVKKRKNIRRQRKADYTHIYKKCPRCKAVLRLPRRKGKHTTICPKCNKEFNVYVLKA